MYRINKLLFVVLIVLVGLLFYQSKHKSDTSVKTEPAIIEPIPGTQLNRVTLTMKAAERLDIQTTPVREELVPSSNRVRKVVPYASIIYDLNGETWVYTSAEPLVFIRHMVTLDYIEADLAILTDGPPTDTEIVTVGVAELYGVDTGVGK